jgi:Carboxypeptidase regulatory-like domain
MHRRPDQIARLVRPLIPGLLPLFALLLLAPSAAGAQSTEILRGNVVDADGQPVPDASVLATGLVTQSVIPGKTNDKGQYTILFLNGEGDYLLTVRKIGYSPITTRVTRTGLSSVLITDVTLKPTAIVLDSITLMAQRLRAAGDEPSIGGVEQNALANAPFLLDPTDLLQLALTVPGVTPVGDSAFSVLGVTPDQNNTTVEGMQSGASNLPQDAISSMRMVTSSADPGRGGFAGGQTSIMLAGGSDLFAATLRGTFVNKTLSWADPNYPSPPPTVGDLSGSVSGAFKKRKSHYRVSFDVNDRMLDSYSLLSPPSNLLSQYGIVQDTVDALSETLTGLGVPRTASGIPLTSSSPRLSLTTTLDFTPAANTSLRISHIGNWGGYHGAGLQLQSYPTTASKFNTDFQQVLVKGSGYIHGMLDELNESFFFTKFDNSPYLNLPSASVRVGTEFADGQTGLTSLRFGGGSGVNNNSSYSNDIRNETSWLSPDSRHKVTLGEEFQYQWSKSFSAGNQYGSYSYLSLADLAANAPASYTRTLDAVARTSKGSTSSFWLRDEWTASQALQFEGGLRLDLAQPGTFPQYNPAVDSIFGLHTDRVPNDVGFVPRLGLTWTSAARRGRGTAGGSSGPLSGLSPDQLARLPPEIAMALMNNQRMNTTALPGISVNGSIGGFKGVTSPNTIGALVDQTGLPNTRRVLSCAGDATPIPDWSALTSPDECLDGTAPAVFSTATPSVQVYDPSYRSPLSWRANLGIDGIRVPGNWAMGLTGIFSYTTHTASGLDLNLNRTPGFHLANEAGRPVYVTPDAIVANTGTIAPAANRIDPDYGAVTNTISDLHGYTEQLTATLVPPHPLFGGKLNINLSYTLSHSRQESRGFGGGFGGGFREIIIGGGDIAASNFAFGGGGSGTAGDPFVKEWVPGSQPTHSFILTTSARLWWFNLQVRANVASGTPFTPLVSGDINGDGIAGNDRAFIPDPATTSDSTLAAQMQQLLNTGTATARNCIRSQLGLIAGANTCHTPWQARLDLALDFRPPQNWGYGDRLRITTTMVNASGALVRLFGLENTPLGQYQSSTTPNSTLLYVTGFDPATEQFKYQVNQLFGEPANFGSARHKFPPFQMQIGLQYRFGGPPTSPLARGMGLIPPGHEPPLTVAQIRQRFNSVARNPVTAIMRYKDSLNLTAGQTATLDSIDTRFRQGADSTLGPLIDWVARHGKHIDDNGLSKRLNKARPVLNKLTADLTKEAVAVLTPDQRKKLPLSVLGVPPMPGMRPEGVGAPPTGKPLPAPGGGDVIFMKGGGGG